MSKYHCLHDAPSATYEECFCGKCGEYGSTDELFEKECPSPKLCHCSPITEHPDVQRLIGQVVELQAEIKTLTADRDSHSKIRQRHLERCGKMSVEIERLQAEVDNLIKGKRDLFEQALSALKGKTQ